MTGALRTVLTIVAVLLFCLSFHPVECQNKAQIAERSASGLYDTIRRIAFPKSPELNQDVKSDSRFILMMPGKILNYQDYHPGKEYMEFVQVRSVKHCTKRELATIHFALILHCTNVCCCMCMQNKEPHNFKLESACMHVALA